MKINKPPKNKFSVCVCVCVRVCCIKPLIQAGLFLRLGYFPGKRRLYHNHTKQTNKQFPFKTVYVLGVRELQTSPCIVYDYTTSGHTDL
jgi:hypothetical protein